MQEVAPASAIAGAGGVAADSQAQTRESSAAATPATTDNLTRPQRARDFGFLHIPRRLRHDHERPFDFRLWLNIFFGVATVFSAQLAKRALIHF